MKKITFLLTVLLAFFLLNVGKMPAWAMDNLSDQEAMKISEPILHNILSAIKSGNLQAYRSNFHPNYQSMVTEQKFNQMLNVYRQKVGDISELKFLGVLNRIAGPIALWKGKTKSTGEDILIILSMKKDNSGQYKLTGQFFQ